MAIGIIGIDCATQAKNTGLAHGFFNNEKAQIDEVTISSNEIDLLGTIVEWTKRCKFTSIALDAPLGWPIPLGQALSNHTAGIPIQTESNKLFRRMTDQVIKDIINSILQSCPTRANKQ